MCAFKFTGLSTSEPISGNTIHCENVCIRPSSCLGSFRNSLDRTETVPHRAEQAGSKVEFRCLGKTHPFRSLSFEILASALVDVLAIMCSRGNPEDNQECIRFYVTHVLGSEGLVHHASRLQAIGPIYRDALQAIKHIFPLEEANMESEYGSRYSRYWGCRVLHYVLTNTAPRSLGNGWYTSFRILSTFQGVTPRIGIYSILHSVL